MIEKWLDRNQSDRNPWVEFNPSVLSPWLLTAAPLGVMNITVSVSFFRLRSISKSERWQQLVTSGVFIPLTLSVSLSAGSRIAPLA